MKTAEKSPIGAIVVDVEALLTADMKTSLATICASLHNHAVKDELM